jgi:ATP-dependent DNA helicase RecG
MTESDLLRILARGEDSRHQFKRDATNADSLAAELAALANSGGGCVLLGVADDGSVLGLDAAAVRRLNQLLSNAASQHVRPPLSPVSHNVLTTQGLVVVTVPDGLNKPYMDLQGRVWVKSGADKRHVTAREEMQRMFQRAGLLQADQVPVRNATAADIDERAFGRYFERRYGQSLDAAGLPMVQLMENLQLAQDGVPNLAGLLLFGKQPQRLLQVLTRDMSRAELMEVLGLKDEKHFRERYQQVAVAQGLVAMTLPDKPKSRMQRYRLTTPGQACLDVHQSKKD